MTGVQALSTVVDLNFELQELEDFASYEPASAYPQHGLLTVRKQGHQMRALWLKFTVQHVLSSTESLRYFDLSAADSANIWFIDLAADGPLGSKKHHPPSIEAFTQLFGRHCP